MKLSVLPIQLPYESEPIQAALSGKKLLATVAKGSDDVIFRVTSRPFDTSKAALHIIKCIDKTNNPHYLPTLVNELTANREFKKNFDSAIILIVYGEVDSKNVTELPDDWVEVNDKLLAGFTGGYRKP